MMISIIGIDATKNAAQISIRTGQLNLFEKKTSSPPTRTPTQHINFVWWFSTPELPAT